MPDMVFKDWYARQAQRFGLHPDPDHPLHHYDYRAAWEAGEEPDASGHWPSKYKEGTHPNLIVQGVNTKNMLHPVVDVVGTPMAESWKTWEPEKLEVPGVIMPLAREWLEIERSPKWARMDPTQRAFMRQDYIRGIEAKNKQIGFSPMELQTLKDTVLINETYEGDSAYDWVRKNVRPAFWASDKTRRAAELKWYRRQRRGVAQYHTPESYIARTAGGAVTGLTYPADPILRRITGIDFFGDELRRQEQGLPGTVAEFAGTVAGFRFNPMMRWTSGKMHWAIRRVLDTKTVSRILPFQRQLRPLIAKFAAGTGTEQDIASAGAIVRHAWKTKEALATVGTSGAWAPIFGMLEGLTPREIAIFGGINVLAGVALSTPRLVKAPHPAAKNIEQFFNLYNQQRIVPLKPGAPIQEVTEEMRQILGVFRFGRINLTDVYGKGPASTMEYADYGPVIGAEPPAPAKSPVPWWIRQAGGIRKAFPSMTIRGVPTEMQRMLPAYSMTGRAPPMPAAAGAGVAGVPSPRGGFDWMPKAHRQPVMLGMDSYGKLGSLRIPEGADMAWVGQAVAARAKVLLPELTGRSMDEIRELVGAIEKGKPLVLPAKATEAKRKASLVTKRGVVTGRNVEIAQRLFGQEIEGAYDAATRQRDAEAFAYAEQQADEARAQMESMPFIDSEFLRTQFPGIWDDLSPSERMRVTRAGGAGVRAPGRHRVSKGQKELPEKTRKQVEQTYLALMRKVYDPRTGAVKKDKETGKLMKHTKAELEQIEQIETLGNAYVLDLTFRTMKKGFEVFNPEDFMVTDDAGQAVMTAGAHQTFGQIVPQFDSVEEFTRWWIDEKLGGPKFTKGRGGRTGIAGAKEQAYHEAMGAIVKYEFPFPQLRDLEDRMADFAQRGHITAPEMKELHGALETLQRGETPGVLKKIEAIPLSRLSETGVKLQAAQKAIADREAFEQFESDVLELAEAQAAEVEAARVAVPTEAPVPAAPSAMREAVAQWWDVLPDEGKRWTAQQTAAKLSMTDADYAKPFAQLTTQQQNAVTEAYSQGQIAKAEAAKGKLFADLGAERPGLPGDLIPEGVLPPAAGQELRNMTAEEFENEVVYYVANPNIPAEQALMAEVDRGVGIRGPRYFKTNYIRARQEARALGVPVYVTTRADIAAAEGDPRGKTPIVRQGSAVPVRAALDSRVTDPYKYFAEQGAQMELATAPSKPIEQELGVQQSPGLAERVADEIALQAAKWKVLGPALTRGYELYVDDLARQGNEQGVYIETLWREVKPAEWRSHDDAVAALADEHTLMQMALKETRPPSTTAEGQRVDTMIRARDDAFNALLDQLDEVAGRAMGDFESVGRLQPDDLPPVDAGDVARRANEISFRHLKDNPEAGGLDIGLIANSIKRAFARPERARVRVDRGEMAQAKLEMARYEDDLAAAHIGSQIFPDKAANDVARLVNKYLRKFPRVERAAKARELPYLVDSPVTRLARKDADLEALFADSDDDSKKGMFRWIMDHYLKHMQGVLPGIPRLPHYVPYMIEWPANIPPGAKRAILSTALRQFRTGQVRHRKSATLQEYARRIEVMAERMGYKVKVLEDIVEITRRYVRGSILLRAGREFMLNASQVDIQKTFGEGPKAQTVRLPLITSNIPRGMYKEYRQLPSDKVEQYWHLLTGERSPSRIVRMIADPETNAQSLKRNIYVLKDHYESLVRIIPGVLDVTKVEQVWNELISFFRAAMFLFRPIYPKNILSDLAIWRGVNWDPTGIVGMTRAVPAWLKGRWALKSPSPEAYAALEHVIFGGVNAGKRTDIMMHIEDVINQQSNRVLKVWKLTAGTVARASSNLMFKGIGQPSWIGAALAAEQEMARHPRWSKMTRNERFRALANAIDGTFGRTPRHQLNRLFEKATRLLLVSPMWKPGNANIFTQAVAGKGFGTASLSPEQRKFVQWTSLKHLVRGFLHLAFWSWLLTGMLNKVNTGKWKHMFFDYPPEYWFYIGTGRKNERGQELMLGPILFAYFMDYLRGGRVYKPSARRQLILSSFITPVGILYEWATNRGTFGEEVVPEKAPFLDQVAIATRNVIQDTLPLSEVYWPKYGKGDPISYRITAAALGTNIRHMRAGQAGAFERYDKVTKETDLHEYISMMTNRDIRELLDRRDHATAARMLAERYVDMGDMIAMLESYYRPHWYRIYGPRTSDIARKQADAKTSKRGIEVSERVIAEEEREWTKKLRETWLPLLREAMHLRGEPVGEEAPKPLRKLEQRMEEMGGLRSTPAWSR